MTAPRSRKETKQYAEHRREVHMRGCIFCALEPGDEQFLTETNSFKLIRNIFPYSIWDSQRVADHLLVVPKQHTDTLSDLTPLQAQEFVQLISGYEKQGYNVYARAPGTATKTVTHQHTHLIKPRGKQLRFLVYALRPHFRISF